MTPDERKTLRRAALFLLAHARVLYDSNTVRRGNAVFWTGDDQDVLAEEYGELIATAKELRRIAK